MNNVSGTEIFPIRHAYHSSTNPFDVKKGGIVLILSLKRTLIISLSALTVMAGLTVGLRLYAGQNTVPSGVTVGGVSVGGMEIGEATQILKQQTTRLLKQPVSFEARPTSSKTVTVQATWGSAGLEVRYNSFLSAIGRLQEGSIWSRVKHRFQFDKEWKLEPAWNSNVLRKQLTLDWESKQFGPLKNAKRTILASDQISYTPEVQAKRINWANLQEIMPSRLPHTFENKVSPVILELPLHLASPPVTVKLLKSQGIARRVSLLTTRLSGTSGRIYNVEAAAQIVDGMLLAPGEIFDYGKVVKKAEQKYGFCEAPVIVQGKLVPGIGGGICQVSGTLYGAVIRAGLEVVERRNHSRPVSYLPKGQDATYSTGYINFQFQNNTDTYILISAKVTHGKLTIKLYGTMPSHVHYEIHSQTVSILSPPVRYVSNRYLSIGEQRLMKSGTSGYIVETTRTKWVKGKMVKKELLSRDTYPAQPTVIAVRNAVSSPDPAKPRMIEDGVEGTDHN